MSGARARRRAPTRCCYRLMPPGPLVGGDDWQALDHCRRPPGSVGFLRLGEVPYGSAATARRCVVAACEKVGQANVLEAEKAT